ncbi:MAG: alpha/beta hydrolase, partial [Flavobacteriales bacterium]|nr:alpha/beta hydrolase [Flavobacteriales bacterium]
MKYSLSALLVTGLLLSHTANAQCDGDRYRNMIFTEATVTSDVEFGSNVDMNGAMTILKLDVYEPEGDSEVDRPLVVFVHGGSFISGSKEGTDVVPLCQDLARMGYVCASINYRLGIPITLNLQQPATEAVVRGVHDFKAAVRYFRKNIAEDGNTWNIDPDQIYSAGVSAGGFVTLHAAYMDEESEIPDYLDLTLAGLTGGLEGESGNPGYSSEVNAVINIAGAIKDTAWIHTGDEPLCSFHGTGDTVVPFDSDMLQMFGAFDVTEVDGSNAIHVKADEVGLENCFEIYWMQGHVPHVDNQQYYDTTRAIMSNFLSHQVCPSIELDCEYREINIVTGIEEQDLTSWVVFPNPATEWFEFPSHLPNGSIVTLYTTNGSKVRSTSMNGTRRFDCSALP